MHPFRAARKSVDGDETIHGDFLRKGDGYKHLEVNQTLEGLGLVETRTERKDLTTELRGSQK